jgi:hypothetical protein
MEVDNNFENKSLDMLKNELTRLRNVVGVIELLIDRAELYSKRLRLLKETIKKSEFYDNVNSKEDLLELLDNVSVEKVTKDSIMFYIKSKINKDNKYLFRCDWKYNFDIGTEDVYFKIESQEFKKPLILEDFYLELGTILHFSLKPMEYITIIISIFYLFDKGNVLDSREIQLATIKECFRLDKNISSICHTKTKKRKLSNSYG